MKTFKLITTSVVMLGISFAAAGAASAGQAYSGGVPPMQQTGFGMDFGVNGVNVGFDEDGMGVGFEDEGVEFGVDFDDDDDWDDDDWDDDDWDNDWDD